MCGTNGLVWVNDNLTAPGFRVTRNVIQSRRFGVLCMARDGRITQNAFVDNPGPSVLLINDDDYDDPHEARKGWMPRNIEVTENTFERCSRCQPDPFHAGSGRTLFAVIGAAVVGPNRTQATEPYERVRFRGVANLTIAHNRIDTWFQGPAISVGDAAGAVVRNNTILAPPDPATHHAAVAVSDAGDVSVVNNTFAGAWSSVSRLERRAARRSGHSPASGRLRHPGSLRVRTHRAPCQRPATAPI